ncbi:MAG: HAD superfamily hydrolase (TIGR01490 family) [Candidatus Azotimanducaceae bacterium]|jgi:HAD superfamily hydrolase (TIGR01490 family)
MKEHKQKVAFFDIDGTVFRSSLFIELVEKLISQEVFPKGSDEAYLAKRELWANREGTYDAYISAVIETFITHLKGVHYGEFADLGQLVVASNSKKVYRYTRDLLEELKKEGYYTIAISQSPKAILDQFCKNYGFDKVYGRMYEIGPTDRFTGVVIDEHLIQNKANIVTRVFERNDFNEKDSIAVGDTEGDIPMLESVDKQICFNPNSVLHAHAKRMDWKVVVERKDMIYTL